MGRPVGLQEKAPQSTISAGETLTKLAEAKTFVLHYTFECNEWEEMNKAIKNQCKILVEIYSEECIDFPHIQHFTPFICGWSVPPGKGGPADGI